MLSPITTTVISTLLLTTSEAINAIGSVGLAAPLECGVCKEHTETSGLQLDHYLNITVYRKEGDIILGGLFPLQYLNEKRGILRYKNVALTEIMAWTIDQINEDKSILDGIKLGYEIRDSFANAPFASVQALELAAKNVFGVVGPGSSKVAVHLASLLGSLSFPMITYAATSDTLSDSTRFRMFARTVPSDEFQCRAMRDIIKGYGWQFVTIIHSPELYGTEGAGELRKILKEDNIYVDKFHSLPEVATPAKVEEMFMMTFQKNTSNANRYHANVIVLFATISYAKVVVEGAKSLKEKYPNEYANTFANLTWIAAESWSDDAEILTTFNKSQLGSFIGLKIRSFEIPEFVNYYRNLKPGATENPWFGSYYKSHYCGGKVDGCAKNIYDQGPYEEPVVLAVESFARTLDRMLKKQYANDTSFSAPGDLDDCVKKASPIKNTSDLYYLRNSGIGSCVYSSLIKDVYQTRTRDKVRFNNVTGDFDAMYTLQTISPDHAVKHDHQHREPIIDTLFEMGVWNTTGLHLTAPNEPFAHKAPPVSVCSFPCLPGSKKIDGDIPICWSCVLCEDNYISNETNAVECKPCQQGHRAIDNNTSCVSIPPTYLKPKHPAAIILIILSVLGITSTILTIAVFIKFRATPLVKASSKELCLVLLVGIAIGFICPFFSIGLPSNEICMMQLVIGNMFGVLTIVPIFLKTARVYALFFQSQRSAGRPPRYLLPMWQSMLCLILVFIEMIIIMFTIIWYPLRKKEKYPTKDLVLVVCEGKTTYDTIVALSVPAGYVLFFAISSTILSYQVRKLPSNFQEAKYICLAQFITLIGLIAFIPSYFVTGGIWQKFCVGIACEICSASFLILIFSKKVEIIVFYPERNKIVFEKDKLSKLDMSRKERRRSFLKSQNCHMCGHSLTGNTTKVGLMQAASIFTTSIGATEKVNEDKKDESRYTETSASILSHSQPLSTVVKTQGTTTT